MYLCFKLLLCRYVWVSTYLSGFLIISCNDRVIKKCIWKNENFFSLDYSTNMCWIKQLDALAKSDPAKCPNVNCMRKYNGMQRKKLLKRHLMYECGVPKQFRCFECSKEFVQNYSLKKHMMFVHERFSL